MLLPIAQAHLTLLLKEGTIFDKFFRTKFLKELRACPLCLGVWTAALVSLLVGIHNPAMILAVAGVGHILFLLREKFLPCDSCKIRSIPFKIVGLE